MEELIAELRARIEARPGRRYSPELKADVIALVEEMESQKWSQSKIVKALSTNWTTIESWRATKPKKLVPVAVKPSPTAKPKQTPLTLRSPKGWSVEVSVSDLKQLL